MAMPSKEIQTVNKPGRPPVKERDPALDLIRIFTLCTVISIHFYLNNGYYNVNVVGIRMYAMTIHRTTLLVCVPLFIVLTGYLSCMKRPGKGCYRGLWKNISIYVLSSTACIVWEFLQHNPYTPGKIAASILGFWAAPYSWYVEMYIGLALLAPFLNVLYHGLESKAGKRRLIAVMLLLTAIPCMFNTYNFTTEGWCLSPSVSTSFQQILPDWWVHIYPITYYFIGCYLREYPPKVKKRTSFSIYCTTALLFGVYDIYRSDGQPHYDGGFLSWYSLPTVILTVSVFTFFLNLSTEEFPPLVKRLLARLSDLCLGAYLVSWISDSILYPRLNAAVPVMQLRLNWIFIVIPAGIFLSFGISFLVDLARQALAAGVRALREQGRK